MRIIGGNLKGSKLYLPEDEKTRPLKDLVRESIFNLIHHSNKVLIKLDQSNVLDIYAGTGSFGLECLSRGAKNISFIENNNNSLRILEKNIEKLKVKKKIKLLRNDAIKVLSDNKNLKKPFDLIFLDPPYGKYELLKIIDKLYDHCWAASSAKIYIESDECLDGLLSSKYELIRDSKAGNVYYGILKLTTKKSQK